MMALKERLEEAISKNTADMRKIYDLCKRAIDSKDYGSIYDNFMKIAPEMAQGTREEFIEQTKQAVEMGQADFILGILQMLIKEDFSKFKYLKAEETDSMAGYYYWNVADNYVTVGVSKLAKEGDGFANKVNYYESSFQSSGNDAEDKKEAMKRIETEEEFKL